jgi:hypothetical protein
LEVFEDFLGHLQVLALVVLDDEDVEFELDTEEELLNSKPEALDL